MLVGISATKFKQAFVNFKRQFFTCDKGVALIELALILPILLVMLSGVIEMSRYIWIHHKILRLTAEISDLVTQSRSMSATEMDVLFNAADYIIHPFDLSENGIIIVSSVSGTGEDPPRVNWKQCGAGNLGVTGTVGATGTVATIPNGLDVDPLDNIIIAEVYYDYKPLIFDSVVESNQISRVAIHSPRISALISIQRDPGQTDGCP
ncbi:TadE/TadG family type IV pilus assembly protein [Kiloniella majae]|uniref:TadE/TadG family type IV pilus assembly protein n=1 Tax=Kiloniella majae TaxID=1938558 RepID=UPI000A2789C5|nr:TadE/TadG family type IV pilus assembly protein [Kiloniella majae]